MSDDLRLRDPATRRPDVAPLGFAAVIALAVVGASLNLGGTAVACLTVAAAAVGCGLTLRRRGAERVLWDRTVEKSRRDVRRLTEKFETLRQDAQQVASAMDRIRDGVILISHTGDVLWVNPAARRYLSVSESAQPIGRPLNEIVRYPPLLSGVEAAETTTKFNFEASDGSTVIPLRVRIDAFGGGRERRVLVTLRDETEAKRIEGVRREFVANISHELKTPLAAIKGYAETVELAIADDPDSATHFIQQIHVQCLRLEQLIADMMQLARAQSGPHQLRIADVSIQDLIRQALATYQPVASAKAIELIHRDEDVGVAIRSDREATLTIINNLVGNAIRYTPHGGRVEVGALAELSKVTVFVQDNGVGIAHEEQSRIFERFYRIEKSRRTGDAGTGIGLAIVRNLTESLGAEVNVESRPGEGSRFEVRFEQASDPATGQTNSPQPVANMISAPHQI